MPFKKGKCPNPSGRPKGSKNLFSKQELEKAIKEVEKGKKEKILQHFVRRAYKNDRVLIALMKKLLPDIPPAQTIEEFDWNRIELAIVPQKPSKEDIKKYQRFYQ